MNEEIRSKVTALLEEKGMSRADLARAIAKHPNTITRALNGLPDGGCVPDLWIAIFDVLDVHLTLASGKSPAYIPPPIRGKPGRKPRKSNDEEQTNDPQNSP